ncbi:MAG: hypothetical protein JWO25_211 [Alphaproteobacteria bacterium]|nr:hypothetical protein [Alphaproteobacteria bacterium]
MSKVTAPTSNGSALERYLKSLILRHRMLDARIDTESRFAGSPRLKRLKRLRLALKDRIAALSRRRQAV